MSEQELSSRDLAAVYDRHGLPGARSAAVAAVILRLERERENAERKAQSTEQERERADERAERFKADVGAWWWLVNDLYQLGCLDCSNNACERARAALTETHPGAALLAELTAARTLAGAIREHPGCLVDDERLDAALAAYDATRRMVVG